MRKHYLMTFAGLLLPALAFGQDSLQTTTLKEVVTSASRFEQSVIEVPRSVTVISKEMIEKSVYNSVGDLLAKQSGIYVVGANQTPGTNQSLFLRGANSNQVAIMIDGTRITDPSSPNSATDLSEISLTDIERIEIIRGSHSTLYGGAAIGGVVNIITKRGAHPGFGGNVSLQSGAYSKGSSTLSDNIGLNYALKNGLYFNLSTFNQLTNGLNASIDTVHEKGVYKTNDKDGFRKNDAFFKTGFKNDKWDVFASYKRVTQHADVDQSAYVDDDNAYLDFNRNLSNYNASYKFSKNWRGTFLGSWSNSDRRNVNDSSKISADGKYDGTYVNDTYKGKILTDEVQVNADYGWIKNVFGGGIYAERMHFNTFYYASPTTGFGPYESQVNYDSIKTQTETKYVFEEVNMNFENFNVTLGSRYSHHSLFGSYTTWEVSPSYKIKSYLLYGSFSQGFNPPSLYQLFDPSKGYGAYTTRGNKNLKAEESSSIEIGVKKEFPSGNHFTVSAYQTKTKNAIEYVYLWNKNTSVNKLTYLDYLGDTYLNASRQTVSGVELEGHVAFRKFYFNGNVTMLKGEINIKSRDIDINKTGGNHVQVYNYGSFVTTDDITVSKLSRRPKANAYAELGFKQLGNFGFSAMLRYAGARNDVGYDSNLGPFGALNQYRVKSYGLIDIGASWQAIKNFTVTLKAENILNTSYQEILGYQTRGRSVYLKLNVKW